MKNLFRWDNPLIQLLTALADVIRTNLLCLICCLPVVTAGASIAATYKVMLNLSQDTGRRHLEILFLPPFGRISSRPLPSGSSPCWLAPPWSVTISWFSSISRAACTSCAARLWWPC